MSKSYYAKLKDPRWQKKRLEVLNRDNFTCKNCGDTESTLHIHHIQYLKTPSPWDYPLTFLSTLCENCHTEEGEEDWRLKHTIVECINNGISSSDLTELIHCIAYIKKNKNVNWDDFGSFMIDLATDHIDLSVIAGGKNG